MTSFGYGSAYVPLSQQAMGQTPQSYSGGQSQFGQPQSLRVFGKSDSSNLSLVPPNSPVKTSDMGDTVANDPFAVNWHRTALGKNEWDMNDLYWNMNGTNTNNRYGWRNTPYENTFGATFNTPGFRDGRQSGSFEFATTHWNPAANWADKPLEQQADMAVAPKQHYMFNSPLDMAKEATFNAQTIANSTNITDSWRQALIDASQRNYMANIDRLRATGIMGLGGSFSFDGGYR